MTSGIKAFRPFGKHPKPPESINSSQESTHSGSQDHHLHIRSRLHALFSPNQHAKEDPPSPPLLSHSEVEDSQADAVDQGTETAAQPGFALTEDGLLAEEPAVKDRDAIKVLMVTWNMGEALPKGDLSVLFGNIPQYEPQPLTDRIPVLPIEDGHPYHIVVVAGQECPTPSGIPKGLSGGLIKGVRTGHKKHLEERAEKHKEQGKEDVLDFAVQAIDALSPGGTTPRLGEEEDSEGNFQRLTTPSPVGSPVPGSVSQRPSHPPGWSSMLDDWFCGSAPAGWKSREQVSSPTIQGKQSIPNPNGLTVPQPPAMIRATSAPVSPTLPLSMPKRNVQCAGLAPLAPPPLSRSQSSSASSSSSSSSEDPGLQTPGPCQTSKSASLPIKSKVSRPGIVIPNDEPAAVSIRIGSYVHVIKERLMGMYLSIYVYKGCEHLLQGVDKDIVTAGLARGRVGNKGGIGISLKIADHTFLFVNSHLAAHTSRLSARQENIAKIKSDLRLDCFLSKDDARTDSEDITDRFDTVFWMGDLNFRLELSRLHAEWLVDQKDYAELLRWDQLRSVMRDPSSNPLAGFQEHAINFPPTFKYDVWKSARATNRELRRSLRRRPTLEKQHSRRPSQTVLAEREGRQATLPHVLEAGFEENATELRQRSDDGTGRSIESGGYMSAASSTAGTDLGDDDDDEDDDPDFHHIDATAYGSKHKAFEVAIKGKAKHFLSLVKMDGILSSSPSKRQHARRVSQRGVRQEPSSHFDDHQSRRSSMTSISSLHEGSSTPQTPTASVPIPIPLASSSRPQNARADVLSTPLEKAGSPGENFPFTSSPVKGPIGPKRSVLKRHLSSKSVKGEDDDDDELDDDTDNREGVYDTSKKQRVPSWCDRVLWKTRVIPDSSSNPQERGRQISSGSKPFNRLSTVFDTIGGHLRGNLPGRSLSTEPAAIGRTRLDQSLPPLPLPNSPRLLFASPMASPSSSPLPISEGLIPSPKRSIAPYIAQDPAPCLRSFGSSSRARHPLTDQSTVFPNPPAGPTISFDLAVPVSSEPRDKAPRRRANSDGPIGNTYRSGTQHLTNNSLTRSDENVIPTPYVSPFSGRTRQSSGGSLRLNKRAATAEPGRISAGDTISYLPSVSVDLPREDQHNAFVRFWRDLPSFLNRPNVAIAVEAAMAQEPGGARRHLQGEVVCLHYGTIDDAGMRQLEGRSDHRPAIFSAAVYV